MLLFLAQAPLPWAVGLSHSRNKDASLISEDLDGDDVLGDLPIETFKDLATQVSDMMKGIDGATNDNGTLASDAVKTTVNLMTDKLKGLAQDKIKAAFAKTRAQIEEGATKLEKLNTDVTTQHTKTNGANEKLSTCRDQEKKALITHEKTHVDSEWANKTRDAACQKKDDARIHDWSITKELVKKHKCDLSKDHCEKLEDLQKHVNEHYAKSKEMREAYQAADKECNKTSDDADAKGTELFEKLTAYESKEAECELQEEVVRHEICVLGSGVQAKCAHYQKLTDLVTKVRDGTDTKYSEADRRDAWKQAETIKCELKHYTERGNIDENVKTMCEAAVDYDKDIGTMDYQSAKIQAVSQGNPTAETPTFTCEETAATIAGGHWATGNESDLYKKEDLYTLNMTISPQGASAFAWCQEKMKQRNCRGFTCEGEFKDKAGKNAILCLTIECSRVECCDGGSLPAAAAASKQAEPAAAAAPAATPEAPEATPEAEAELVAKKAKAKKTGQSNAKQPPANKQKQVKKR
jgi:hypothetical protein